MNIELRGYGNLSEKIGSKEWIELEVGKNATVTDVIDELGLENNQIMTVLVQGEYVERDYILNHEDRVEFIPLISGG